MKDTKIILVDGMPGTGKSTVSQYIYLQLKANQQPAYWCHEEQNAHPVCLFFNPKRHRSEAQYIEDAATQWQKYADRLLNENQIAVLDAAFLQNHLRSMLIFDCQREIIAKLFQRIENIIAPLNPVLYYLRPKNLEKNFQQVVSIRGERMLELWLEAHNHYPYTLNARSKGYPGFIAFWQEFSDLSDRIFKRLTMTKLQVNVPTANNSELYSRIFELLNCPLSEIYSLPLSLDRYAGKYTSYNDENSLSFVLKAQDGFLITSIDQPTIDIKQGPIECFREIRLIPKEKNTFYVEAWPHEVQFTEDRSGEIENMRLSLSQKGWETLDKIYVKQTIS